MNAMIRIVVLSCAAVLASPTLAQATQPAPTAAPTAAKPKLICEKQEQLGTRLGGLKVCHTKAEWDELRAQARQDLEQNQRMNSSTGKPAG
jgi:hypothetical protein